MASLPRRNHLHRLVVQERLPLIGVAALEEQVLLLGQVVLSLSSAGFATVSVVDAAGAPLAVPLPDGRLRDRPATALDYASLIRPL